MTRDEELQRYNCTDACVTWDVWHKLGVCLKDDGLKSADAFQQCLFGAVLRTMHRGVRFDEKRRDSLKVELGVERDKRLAWIERVLGEPLNIGSVVQMRKLFFEQLKCSPGRDKALDDNALAVHADREPLLAPLIKVIRELRSINVFSRNFLEMQADEDGRMRCSYNVAGTTTYRLSSSENCFGRGGNLQNLPKGGDDDEGLCLPNIRSLFVPDDGCTIFDLDLSKADLRIVVWEADEQEAKAMLREGRDPYVELAREFYKDNTIKKTRDDGSEHPLYKKFKSFAHGCVTKGHEVLTPKGWVKVEEYQDGTPIMTCTRSGYAHFEIPEKFTRDLGVHFHSIRGQSSDFEFTHDHRMPYTTDSEFNIRVKNVSDIPEFARIPSVTMYEGKGVGVKENTIRLVVALQADGSIDSYGNVRFHFRRERKIKRIISLLKGYGAQMMRQKDGTTSFYIPREKADFAKWGKEAGKYLLEWSGKELDVYIEELKYWDGHYGGTIKCHVSSVSMSHCEWLQTIIHLRGQGGQLRVHRESYRNRRTLYRVSSNRRKFINLQCCERRIYETSPQAVYCPTVSTGLFLLRRNGHIVVSGNTNYMGSARGIAYNLGLTVKEAESTQAWYFGKFPGIKRYQERIVKEISTQKFVRNVFGYRHLCLGRSDEHAFRKAAAWIPQSTIGILINHIWIKLVEEDRKQHATPQLEILMQVHDSLVGQFRKVWDFKQWVVEKSKIVIPYDDPLVIPVGVKTSDVSWGDVT